MSCLESVFPRDDLPSRQSTGRVSKTPTNSTCFPSLLTNSTFAIGTERRYPVAINTVNLSPVNAESLTYLLCIKVLVHPESTTITALFPFILPLAQNGEISDYFDANGVMHSRYACEDFPRPLPQLSDM